jgi:hypothetical protein
LFSCYKFDPVCGRWNNIPRENRKCTLYNLGEIGDEFHYALNSPYFKQYRYIDKSDDFNFPIVNLPFICSNIPAAPAYGVYISQFIRYYRACGTYQDYIKKRYTKYQILLAF